MGRPLTDHDAVRRRLVAHGRALIREGGVRALVLADVARRERLATPSLYHYFANRRALLLAVLQAEVDELLEVSASPKARTGDEDRLRRFMEAQVAYLDRTSPQTVAFVLEAVLDAAGDQQVAAVVGPVFGRAEAVFRSCAGDLARRASPKQQRAITDLLRASLAGLFLMRAVGTDFDAAAVDAELRKRLGARSSKSI